MNTEPAPDISLAPNERARVTGDQNKFVLFKKIIIIFSVIAVIFTLIFVFSILHKRSASNIGTIPTVLAAIPTFPGAQVSNSTEKVVENEKTYTVTWVIDNKETQEVASWYTAMLSDDDATERYEVVESPDDYTTDIVKVVYRKDGKLYKATFTKEQNDTIVLIEHIVN